MTTLRPEEWISRLAGAMRDHERERASSGPGLSRYEIQSEIKRGGMGSIHRAWDRQLGRPVALKFVAEGEKASPEAHARLLQEAQLAARLSHPNIVPVFDTGTWNGQVYLSMQFIEGTTIDRAALDHRGKLAAVRDAARALEYAHRQGVVHRDVKPANLMVDVQGNVYVTDFGVARRVDLSSRITLAGTILGTPCYMSPEQARGDAVDARTDVYSLGATLYELLTGNAPFADEDVVKVLAKVRREEPVPLRKLAPSVPRDAETLVLKAMAKEAGKRYATAGEFADDIERCLRGRPIEARRASTAYRLRKGLVRHRWRVTAAVSMAALATVLGYLISSDLRRRSLVREAEELHRRADGEPEPAKKLDLLRRARELLRNASQVRPELDERLKGWESWVAARREPDLAKKTALLETAEPHVPGARHELDLTLKALEVQKGAQEAEFRKLEAQIDDCKRLIKAGDTSGAQQLIQSLSHPGPDFPGNKRHLRSELPRLRAALAETRFRMAFDRLAALEEPSEFHPAYAVLTGPDFESVKDLGGKLFTAAIGFAQKMMEKSQYLQAIHWFNEAEKHQPPDLHLYEQRGRAYAELREWGRAWSDFQKFKKDRPPGTPIHHKFADLVYREARIALRNGEWAKSRAYLNETLEIDGGHVEAYHDRGLVRDKEGEKAAAALKDLDLALERKATLKPKPEYGSIVVRYARELTADSYRLDSPEERDQHWNQAAGWLTRALEGMEGSRSELLLERAKMHRRLRKYTEALRDAEEAQDGAEARLVCAQIRYVLAHEEPAAPRFLNQAVVDLIEAERFDPRNPAILFWRGTCRNSVMWPERGEDARKLALRDLGAAAKEKFPGPDVFLQMAILGVEIKERLGEAVSHVEEALTRSAMLNEDDLIAGLHEAKKRTLGGAVRILKRDIFHTRARARYHQDQYKLCIDDCTTALSWDDRSAPVYMRRGYARFKEEQFQQALEDFQRALEFSSDPQEKTYALEWSSACRAKLKK